jgi:alkanesulfonate monooxygenase SsuD/methylene tetrahydromethanopterin reductase-like flavin-dependent oxidoreductase (luciferase family)
MREPAVEIQKGSRCSIRAVKSGPGHCCRFATLRDMGRERGWPPMTRASFEAQREPHGALLVGSPSEIVDKILRHSETLGGLSRISFQMNAASLPHEKLMHAIETIGARVVPALHAEAATASRATGCVGRSSHRSGAGFAA